LPFLSPDPSSLKGTVVLAWGWEGKTDWVCSFFPPCKKQRLKSISTKPSLVFRTQDVPQRAAARHVARRQYVLIAPLLNSLACSLVCPECIELYQNKNMATLPCLHPICTTCVENKNDTDEYVCRFFREGLLCNHEYKKDQVLVVAAAKKAEICGSCEENPATHSCKTCGLLLCSDEFKGHTLSKNSKGHVVVPLPSALAALQNPCEIHKTVPATLYCKQCDRLICNDCVQSHSGHAIQSLTDGLATRSELIKTKLSAVEKKCNDLNLGGNNEAKQDLDFVTAHLATTAAKVDEAFDSITHPLQQTLDEIRARKQELRKQAQDAIGADVKTLEQQVDALATFKHDVDYVKAAAAASPASQALVSARLAALDKVAVDSTSAVKETSHFVYSQPADVAKLLESLKAVQVAQLGSIAKSALRAPPKIVRDYNVIGAPVKIIGKRGAGQGESSYPMGLAVDTAGNLVVGEQGNKRVQIFNKEGGHVRFINCGVAVWGVSVAPSGEVWVANGGSELCLYNPQSSALVRSIAAKPLYCASLPDGSVVVSTNGPHVRLYNSAGVQQWESTGSGLANTYGVCHVPDINAVAVCEFNNKQVQLLSLADGRHVRTIGAGQMSSYPYSIAYDVTAKILVVGEDDKVSAWTLDGQLVHQWGKGTVNYAYGVAIDPSDNTIYVSDYNYGRILVF